MGHSKPPRPGIDNDPLPPHFRDEEKQHVFHSHFRTKLVLAGHAVLAFNLSVVASKHDRQASEEIAVHHGAQPDVGRYNKLLIPRERLAEVRKIAGGARREHYFMTQPWDDNGYRVLPAAVYLEHAEKLREYSRKFTAAVDVFAAQFDQLVIESRSRLGSLFRPEDYPTSKEIRDKFAFETEVMPLPDGDDFRVNLGDD